MTIKEIMLAVPVLIIGWLGLLGFVGLLSDDAPAQIVMFPDAEFLQNLPADVAVLDANGWSITVASYRDGLVQTLYENGAMLVLPAGLQGCGSQRKVG